MSSTADAVAAEGNDPRMKQQIKGTIMNLEGKTAIVTGAGAGIGRAIALRLAAEGAKVAALDLNKEKAAQTAESIRSSGKVAMAIIADVTKGAEVKAAVAKVLADFGKIDILVNCAGGHAGLIGRIGPFKDTTEDVWRWVIDLNLNGTLLCTHSVISHMVDRKYGKIINIASIAAKVGIANFAEYSAAKGGVVSFTKALAMEVGPYNVNVNSVSPGAILSQEERDYENTGIFLPRKGGAPADVAAVVAFLASDDAAFVTGADYVVDGGRCLGPRGA